MYRIIRRMWATGNDGKMANGNLLKGREDVADL